MDTWTDVTWSIPGVRFMIWGKTVFPPRPQASLSRALSATTALLSLSSSFNQYLKIMDAHRNIIVIFMK